MKNRLSFAVSLLALAAAAPAAAGDRHDCIDESCTMVSLIDSAADQSGSSGSAVVEAQRLGSWGIDLAGMDRSVKPGDDFFAYVNGNWAKTTPIPADRSSYGAFAVLRDLSEARLRQLVESYPAGDPATGGDQAKVAALYRSFMDEEAAERQDAIPLLARIAPIYQAKTREDLAQTDGPVDRRLRRAPSSVRESATTPRIRSTMRSTWASRASASATATSTSTPSSSRRRTAISPYVAQMLEMAGWPTPQESAAKVVALETRIAEAHWTRAREPQPRQDLQSDDRWPSSKARRPASPGGPTGRPPASAQAERAVVSAEHRRPQAREDLRRDGPPDPQGLADVPHRRTTWRLCCRSGSSTPSSSSAPSS